MALLNYLRKEIDAKIVYYGPGLCGKTTNIQCIHQGLQPDQRGNILSLSTDQDVTLFFDFLPIELEDVQGFKVRFHLFTVPGQVYYKATRRAVLMGADGVVFVADSQIEKMEDNLLSIKELEENLCLYGKKLKTTPFIIQYNKRDLPNILPVEELNQKINYLGVPYFESVAIEGKGVFESLTLLCRMVLKVIQGGAEAREAATTPHTVCEVKGTEGSTVERRVPRPEPPRVNQEVPTPRPISSPGKDNRLPEPSRPSLDAAPRKLHPGKAIPQMARPRPATIPFSPAAKPGGEMSNTDGGSIISRLLGKKKPESHGEGDENHKKEIFTSKQKMRPLSFGEPRVSSPGNLEIPLTLEVDGLGEKRSFVITVKLEELEPKAD